MHNTGVRIIVHEPPGLKNLIGIIISERKDVIRVKLTHTLEGDGFKSNVMDCHSQDRSSFNRLKQHYCVAVTGYLVDESMQKSEFCIKGVLSVD